MPGMTAPRAGISTRSRIVAAILAIEALALAILIWHGMQLESARVESAFTSNLARLRAVLIPAVHGPLEARDLAALQRILERTREDAKLDYIFAKDEEGRVVASAGGREKAAPQLDAALQDAFDDRRFDTAFTVPLKNA